MKVPGKDIHSDNLNNEHFKRCVSMQPEGRIVYDIFELVTTEKQMQVGKDSTEGTLHINIYYIDIYIVWPS